MKKLVRDRIPEIMSSQHKVFCCYQANQEEYRERLKEKLKEEVEEFLAAETIEELVDILDVLEAISQVYSFQDEQIQAIRQEKQINRGKFAQRYVIES